MPIRTASAHLKFCGLAIALGMTFSVQANEGVTVMTGGAWNFGKSKNVHMVSEDLRIRLVPDKGFVEVNYRFRNDGPAQNVTMGFPEYTTDQEGGTTSNDIKIFVDGKKTPIKYRNLDYHKSKYGHAWMHTVHFKKGQTRKVQVRYWSWFGRTSCGVSFFEYIMETAGTWAGPIQNLRIQIDASGISRKHDFFAYLPTMKRDKKEIPSASLKWVSRGYRKVGVELRNVTPLDGIEVIMPHGFWQITVNGNALDPRKAAHEMPVPGFPFWKNGKLWVPTQATNHLFEGYELPRPPRGYSTNESSRYIRWKDESYGELTAEYIGDLVRKWHGTWRYDKAKNRVYITLPQKRKNNSR